MSTLTSKFVALIDADGSGAVKELGKISAAADKANLAAGKSAEGLKAKIGGFASSISPAALTGGLVAAGSAVAAFAVSSVGHFQDLGVEVGKFRDATGLSADEASRFIEVSGDLGIDAGTVEGALGKMNKAAANTPGAFKDAGIEIARTKDGAVDANQTFLNTVGVLSSIQDPALRAATATKIFGKGYQGMSEIIFGGSEKIKSALAGVEKQKIFDDSKVQKARDLRTAFDNLHDSFEDVQLEIGSALAPAISHAAEQIATLVQNAESLINLFGTTADATAKGSSELEKLGHAAGNTGGFFQALGGQFKKVPLLAQTAGRAFSDVGSGIEKAFGHDDAKTAIEGITHAQEAQNEQANAAVQYLTAQAGAQADLASTDAAATVQALADADKNAADQAQRLADVNTAAADAINGRVDAQRAATDDVYAGQKADRDFADSLTNVNDVASKLGKKGGSTLGDLADSIDKARENAVGLSDSAVKLGQDNEAAGGKILSAKGKIDLQNTSLLNSAKTANGPVRDAILGYIGTLNGIPPEKVSEIKALLNKGDIAGAEAVINNTSRTRNAAINADANTSNAERELNNTARDRVAHITAAISAGGSQNFQFLKTGAHASGGVAKGLSLVGERGPELIDVGQSSRVYDAATTRGMLGGGAPTINLTINAGMGADGTQLGRVITEHLRRYNVTNGPLPITVRNAG